MLIFFCLFVFPNLFLFFLVSANFVVIFEVEGINLFNIYTLNIKLIYIVFSEQF